MLSLEPILVRFPHLEPHDFYLMYDLRLAGETIAEIAEKFEVTQCAVAAVIRTIRRSRAERRTQEAA